jgi:prephenate dehydrogenase
MKTVAVAGVGLIGASFGLALRRAGFSGRIIGVSSAEAIKAGLAAGAISESGSLEDAAHEADLIYLAQPIDRILDTIQKLGPMVRSECLVTDAGSTKATIIDISKKYMHPGIFLGGHPIAGKEQRGAEAADATLFQNRP